MNLKSNSLSHNTIPVYLDCRHFDGSGIGTYISNLISNFNQYNLNYPIEILTRDEHIPQIKKLCSFKIITYNDPIYSVREQFKWVNKINPFGLLHVPLYNAPLFYPGNLITTVHDICHIAMRQFFPGALRHIYSDQFLRMVLKKSDFVITVSNFSKSEIINYFNIPEEKIRVIYNGVNPIFRPIGEEQRNAVLKKHNLPSEFLLYIGNVKPHKNITGLVESYIMALKRNPDLPALVISGRYNQLITATPNIRKLIAGKETESRIIFTGYLPTVDLPAIYSQALMFLFPSFYEGFGLPNLEAMACGTPVITSNCSSIPEVVGNSAILIDPYNCEMISDAILNLAGNSELQQTYRERGLSQAQKFSWDKSAREHVAVYNQTIGLTSRQAGKLFPSATVPQNRKANILFMDQFGDRIGGGQIILLDILENFRSRDKWNIFISVPNEGLFTKILKDKKFSYWCVPIWKPSQSGSTYTEMFSYLFSSIKSTYLLSKKIKKYNIDIVYCNGGRTFLSGSFLSFLFKIRIYWHMHVVMDRTQMKVVTTLGRLPKVIHILTASHTVKKQYNGYAIQNKIITIDNWVSPDLIATPLVKRNEQLINPIRVGLVGQIFHAKGQWTTLESLLQAKNVFPLQLLIYGNPLPEEAEKWEDFQETVKELIRIGWDIQFLGYQQSKIKIYDNLDVLVIPSLLPEAFGLTAIEAMAREVVVISNRSGELANIIQNKVNGFFYNSKCFDELIPILQDLLDQTYDISDIRNQGLETVRQHYNPTKQLERLHSLLAEGLMKKAETATEPQD